MMRSALTTYDNPYNPFDDFSHWFQFDTTKGYNTSELLARFVGETEDLSEVEIETATTNAIKRILAIDLECIYKVVEQDVESEYTIEVEETDNLS